MAAPPTTSPSGSARGDVAIDLYRPVGLLGWYLAGDLGRAAYHLLTRGLAPDGGRAALLFDIALARRRGGRAGLRGELPLAVVVSFAMRFLVACSAFWLLDAQGAPDGRACSRCFLSGMVLPLVIFPGRLREVALALPWASYLQTPADIWLGKRTGLGLVAGLGLQVLWALVLLGLLPAGAACRHPQGRGPGWLTSAQRRGPRLPRRSR